MDERKGEDAKITTLSSEDALRVLYKIVEEMVPDVDEWPDKDKDVYKIAIVVGGSSDIKHVRYAVREKFKRNLKDMPEENKNTLVAKIRAKFVRHPGKKYKRGDLLAPKLIWYHGSYYDRPIRFSGNSRFCLIITEALFSRQRSVIHKLNRVIDSGLVHRTVPEHFPSFGWCDVQNTYLISRSMKMDRTRTVENFNVEYNLRSRKENPELPEKVVEWGSKVPCSFMDFPFPSLIFGDGLHKLLKGKTCTANFIQLSKKIKNRLTCNDYPLAKLMEVSVQHDTAPLDRLAIVMVVCAAQITGNGKLAGLFNFDPGFVSNEHEVQRNFAVQTFLIGFLSECGRTSMEVGLALLALHCHAAYGNRSKDLCMPNGTMHLDDLVPVTLWGMPFREHMNYIVQALIGIMGDMVDAVLLEMESWQEKLLKSREWTIPNKNVIHRSGKNVMMSLKSRLEKYVCQASSCANSEAARGFAFEVSAIGPYAKASGNDTVEICPLVDPEVYFDGDLACKYKEEKSILSFPRALTDAVTCRIALRWHIKDWIERTSRDELQHRKYPRELSLETKENAAKSPKENRSDISSEVGFSILWPFLPEHDVKGNEKVEDSSKQDTKSISPDFQERDVKGNENAATSCNQDTKSFSHDFPDVKGTLYSLRRRVYGGGFTTVYCGDSGLFVPRENLW